MATIDDLRIIGNENLTLEMYVSQLTHLKKLDLEKVVSDGDVISPINEENIPEKKIEDKSLESNIPNRIKNQLKSTDQIKTNPIKNINNQNEKTKIEITSFQDLINQSNKEKEIELKYDLERNVKLLSFNRGKIDISFNEKLNKNFIKNLTEKLHYWTGERWIISLSKSIYEKNLENKKMIIEEYKKSKVSQEIKNSFPDAELIDINEDE